LSNVADIVYSPREQRRKGRLSRVGLGTTLGGTWCFEKLVWPRWSSRHWCLGWRPAPAPNGGYSCGRSPCCGYAGDRACFSNGGSIGPGAAGCRGTGAVRVPQNQGIPSGVLAVRGNHRRKTLRGGAHRQNQGRSTGHFVLHRDEVYQGPDWAVDLHPDCQGRLRASGRAELVDSAEPWAVSSASNY